MTSLASHQMMNCPTPGVPPCRGRHREFRQTSESVLRGFGAGWIHKHAEAGRLYRKMIGGS